VRSSGFEYGLDNLSNKLVHLTNDAIQKYSDSYGKYEQGNKISFAEFQKYLDQTFPEMNINFNRDIMC
jgi:tubulin polyglutamylase TTLL1